MSFARVVCLLLYCLLLFTCRKVDVSKVEQNEVDSLVIFTGLRDVRIAQLLLKTGFKYTFFGRRDASGIPKSITGYSSLSPQQKRPNFVTLNENGLISNILLGTGEMLHLEYLYGDSLRMTISSDNGILETTKPIGFKVPARQSEKKSQPFFSNSVSADLQIDNNVDVKVISKEKTNNLESLVKNDEAVVIVRAKGRGFDYEVQAPFNSASGWYSVPMSSLGLDVSAEKDAIDKTLNLLKSVLNAVCSRPHSGDVLTNITVVTVVTNAFCPVPLPHAQAICIGSKLALAGCLINLTSSVVPKITKRIDPNSTPVTSAVISATSRHFKFGSVTTSERPLHDLVLTQGYDLLATHEYEATKESDLSILSGNNQQGSVSARLPQLINFKLVDSENQPIQGATLRSRNISGNGKFTALSASDENGQISAVWILGSTVGQQLVEVFAVYADGEESERVTVSANAAKSDEILGWYVGEYTSLPRVGECGTQTGSKGSVYVLIYRATSGAIRHVYRVQSIFSGISSFTEESFIDSPQPGNNFTFQMRPLKGWTDFPQRALNLGWTNIFVGTGEIESQDFGGGNYDGWAYRKSESDKGCRLGWDYVFDYEIYWKAQKVNGTPSGLNQSIIDEMMSKRR